VSPIWRRFVSRKLRVSTRTMLHNIFDFLNKVSHYGKPVHEFRFSCIVTPVLYKSKDQNKKRPDLRWHKEAEFRSLLHGIRSSEIKAGDINRILTVGIYLWLYSPLLVLGRFFSFLILYTVGRTPSTGDQPVSRSLPTHTTTQTQNKGTQYRHSCLEWDSNPRSQPSSGRR
jgi:hypothetical protein